MTDLKILWVDDDAAVRHAVAQTLDLAGHTVVACASAEEAQHHLGRGFAGMLLTDVRLPGASGLELLAHTREHCPHVPVVLVTAHGDIGMAVQAMQAGAYEFLEKPFTPDAVLDACRRALERCALQAQVHDLKRQLSGRKTAEAMLVGHAPAMVQLRQQIENLAGTRADVLLMGETGTGKELVARCLHELSPRRERQFVAINCGGLPDTLVESELFGHEAGAFTHAAKRRVGRIEYADGGTLLLDEIESMPPQVQVKLLRVLQERQLERLGANAAIAVDVRVVAASKVDLRSAQLQPRFRPDLYYRLSVAVLHLPPLRERKEDIPLLFEHFLAQASARHGRELPTTDRSLMHRLLEHDWPGNVRELRNSAERVVLGLGLGLNGSAAQPPRLNLAQQMQQVEKLLIEQALRQHRGRASATCEALGISRTSLYERLARHGIAIEGFRAEAEDPDQGA